jgi:hypothetical protein
VIARRVIGTAAVVMIGAVLSPLAVAGSASAGESALRPRVWVGRVCAQARPVAERLGPDLAEFKDLSATRPVTKAQLVEGVRLFDALVGGLADFLVELRDGVEDAGLPRIRDRERVVARIVSDLDAVLDELAAAREGFATFFETVNTDPVGAAEAAADAIETHLSTEAFAGLLAPWPRRLAEAMAAAPACVEVKRLLEAGTPAL